MVALLYFLFLLPLSYGATTFDIIVYGATPAGCVAAISAAWHNSSLKIGLIEPSAYIGGMSVAGGIGLRDLGNETSFINTIGYSWAMMNAQYYKVSYPVYQADMFVMQASLYSMIAKFDNIELILNTSLLESGGVEMSGATIASINTQDTRGANAAQATNTAYAATVFIDATYEGDLARFANVSYTYGRESVAQYGEAHAGVRPYSPTSNFVENQPVIATYTNNTADLIPYIDAEPLAPVGQSDDRMMGYSYRLCVTPTKSRQAPFFPPPNYNASDFLLLQRYVQSLVASGSYPNGPPIGDIVDIFNYRNYPPGDKFDLCDGSAAFTSDAINLNRGYVEAAYAGRAQIAAMTYYYVLGLVYFLATDPSIPEFTRNSTKRYGLCNDQWIENMNIPPQLYVREGLRIIGDYVFTENDVIGAKFNNESIGVGSWFFDIHVVSRTAVEDKSIGQLVANNEGNLVENIAGSGNAYEIPIGILFPKRSEVTNLVVPVCHSATHVAYASTRVEPTFVQLGESSGLVAALSIFSGDDVQSVDVTAVQNLLTKRGVKVHVQG